MSELEFLSPDRIDTVAGFAPSFRSPLARALPPALAGVEDVSHLGKIEVRGDLGGLDEPTVVRIHEHRALVLCDYGAAADLRERLRERFDHVADVTAAFAGVRVAGEQLLRRLTDLPLDELPAAGAVAHVPALVLRDGDEFTIFFAQEYGHYVAEVVLDALAGLR